MFERVEREVWLKKGVLGMNARQQQLEENGGEDSSVVFVCVV